MSKFISLRSKMYAYEKYNGTVGMRGRGIKWSVLKK